MRKSNYMILFSEFTIEIIILTFERTVSDGHLHYILFIKFLRNSLYLYNVHLYNKLKSVLTIRPIY